MALGHTFIWHSIVMDAMGFQKIDNFLLVLHIEAYKP